MRQKIEKILRSISTCSRYKELLTFRNSGSQGVSKGRIAWQQIDIAREWGQKYPIIEILHKRRDGA